MKKSTLNFSRTIMRRALLSLACCTALAANADIVGGDVYTIVLANANHKTLFVEDSSPDSLVCMWTETHVPAQQWRVINTGGQTYAFQNLYTGKYLSYRDNSARGSRIGQEMNVTSKSKWTLEPVDAQNNVYSFNIGGCSLCTSDTTDRKRPTLSNNVSGYRWKEWKLIKVDNPITEFNAQARDEMLNDYMRKFVKVRPNSMLSFENGGWVEAVTMEILLDAYEETHNPNLRAAFYKMYDRVKWGIGDDWTGGPVSGHEYSWWGYDFNDDVAWMIVTAAHAHHLFGDKVFLDDAKRNFDAIYKRAFVPGQGLIRWAERSNVNPDGSFVIASCVNGPMEIAACYIGMGSGDESYFQKARDLYAHQRVQLADMSKGRVYDSYRSAADGMSRTQEPGGFISTYNQGTMMGAAVLLYKHYNDQQYKKDAEKIMEFSQKTWNPDGCDVIRNWNATGDLGVFKGILMRYVRRLIVDCGDTQYIQWMKDNAFRAYNNRNSQGFTSSAWLEKSSENMVALNGNKYDGSPQCGTALSAAMNVPLGTTDSNGNDKKTFAATFEAELATFNGGVNIIRDNMASFGMYVGNLGGRRNRLSFDYVAPEDGVYNVKVYYMALMDCDMSVSNGSENPIKFPKTEGWTPTHMDTLTVQLELKKGSNTIVVGNSKSSLCPNIDKFEVTLNYSTGIIPVKTSVKDKSEDDRWYNLQGQQVTAPKQGIYIHRGKKVIVK